MESTWQMQTMPSEDSPYSMILIMGVTGSGKSYFLNQLVQGAVIEGPGLNSGGSNVKGLFW